MRSLENKFYNESYSLKPQIVYQVLSCMIRNSMAMATNNLLRVNMVNRNWWRGNLFSRAEKTFQKPAHCFNGSKEVFHIINGWGIFRLRIKRFKVGLELILLSQAAGISTINKKCMKDYFMLVVEKNVSDVSA